MHGMRLIFGKPPVKKRYNVFVILVISAKGMEARIVLTEDCFCDLNVPIPNGYTIALDSTWNLGENISKSLQKQLNTLFSFAFWYAHSPTQGRTVYHLQQVKMSMMCHFGRRGDAGSYLQ